MKRHEQKVKEGEERNQVWRDMTPDQQRSSLDRRLGKGIGAKRQRKKLDANREAV